MKSSRLTWAIFIALFLTVGYSSFYAEMDIDNLLAYYRTSSDIRITAFSIDSTENNAESLYEEFESSSISSSVSSATGCTAARNRL